MSIADHYRIKAPCSNCPFKKEGAIDLAPGRLDGIVDALLSDDTTTFLCHKVVHSKAGGAWSDDGDYQQSGSEAMCAGAAAFLMKIGRPTVGMRLAIATGDIAPDRWFDSYELVINETKTGGGNDDG
ncbi:hypothetical protein A3709_20315 [Halioglobus sp. HI00S01]|uniref:hypothetical protein n=1 Tax=Halioglobus sp. HI00S01 TaxID=1822214 RepID=UPI0007C31CE9|nr:hypothetical protein [Halioglobus sp. HI00S01]KZX57958.1 hypothetical protein A3709_20315 [Halioglobus sp. HI00S01]